MIKFYACPNNVLFNLIDQSCKSVIVTVFFFRRIWDVTDYVVPPTESNAFFVTTNVIITPDQEKGTCAEDPETHGAKPCDPIEPGVCFSLEHLIDHL